MTDEEYLEIQSVILMTAGNVMGLDLEGFLTRIKIAEAAGPVIDPTSYRAGMERLSSIKRLAEAFKTIQGEYERTVQSFLTENNYETEVARVVREGLS